MSKTAAFLYGVGAMMMVVGLLVMANQHDTNLQRRAAANERSNNVRCAMLYSRAADAYDTIRVMATDRPCADYLQYVFQYEPLQ